MTLENLLKTGRKLYATTRMRVIGRAALSRAALIICLSVTLQAHVINYKYQKNIRFCRTRASTIRRQFKCSSRKSSSTQHPIAGFWYGFRGRHPAVYYLSPWEFVMWWEVVECSESLHIEEEEKFRVAFPIIPGQVQLAGKFYMKRRCRPVVTRVWTSF